MIEYLIGYTIIALLIGLISFGFSLFVIESPYLNPVVNWFDKRKDINWFYKIIAKGLRCYTCTSFWGGILGAFFLDVLSSGLLLPHNISLYLLCLFTFGCLGSGVGTTGSYLMSVYFDILGRKKK